MREGAAPRARGARAPPPSQPPSVTSLPARCRLPPLACGGAARALHRLRGNARKGRLEAARRPEMTLRLARRRWSRAGAMSAGGGAQRDAGAAGG